MPGEVIDRPNPQPIPSNVPDDVLSLVVKLEKTKLDEDTYSGLQLFRRAANYITAAMIFLHDNVYSERDLTFDDIKPRLLGHWGTCPGLTLVYSHLNLLVTKHDLNLLYVVGPGHGAPAILASLWIEGSLEKIYPEYGRTRTGLHNLITRFSTPSGLPSHINAETPGAIHEGGELGYALSVAFGAVMDKPDLVVACIVGDGEAETGPTATAWHGYKYIDPAESGAVIPIVHVNGFKISERTIYGCMDDKEMAALFTGYGYQARFVEDLADIDADVSASMEWALDEIRNIQKAARSGKPIMKPRWPVLILRTPKGWGGPKKVKGEFVEGSFHAHQVPLMAAKSDDEELKQLQEWLGSYKPHELFTKEGGPTEAVTHIVPKDDTRKIGQTIDTCCTREILEIPDWEKFSVKKGDQASCMATIGELLDEILVKNPKSIRIFSPDELVSNKLDAVLRHTGRDFQWDQFSNAQGGRVIEILSEHMCEGFLQGYTLTGRTGLFPSYESFLGIVHTMMVQYSKFNKMARETNWRKDISSINYLETSTWTRQEHNGFSHQNPSFIGAVLNLKPDAARVYLPPDANTFLSTTAHCLRSKNYVNLMVGSKQPQPVFLTASEAESHCRAGASIWKFASTDEGLDPDVVLVGIGAELTFEVIGAAAMLRKLVPQLRVRVINVTDLMILGLEGSHPHALNHADFDALFTPERPIHFNYHGYANEIKGLLFGRPNLQRVSIESYREEGSTTTPFDMMLRNHVSRYHVAEAAIKGGAERNERVRLDMHELLSGLRHDIVKTQEYIMKTSKDPEGTYDTPSFESDGKTVHRDVGNDYDDDDGTNDDTNDQRRDDRDSSTNPQERTPLSPERRRLFALPQQQSSTSPLSTTSALGPLSHIAAFGRLQQSMPSAEEPASSPIDKFSSTEEALTHYKSQYEQLETELTEFQASSRELEAELEKEVEASDKRESKLREKVEGLKYEVDEWKTKYKQAKTEANTVQNTLQKEITTLRDTNRTIQLKLRDIEVANDDFEKQARNTTSSLEDLESKYNVAIERGVMLEEEVKVGEQEREALRIETQRLRDELSDLKIEAEITQDKLRRAAGAPQKQHLRKPTPLGPGLALPQTPTSEVSPATTTSSPTIATPPGKSTSSTVSDAPTPPSPPMSERSETVVAKSSLPRLSRSRVSAAGSDSTPRPLHNSARPARHSRGPSIPISNGRTPSLSRLAPNAPLHGTPAQAFPRSGSLYQIRGLIGKMQKLEERVQSARSKLPAPTHTPPRASPRSGSALGQSHVPATVTMRSPKKRTGGSNASLSSSLRGTGESTPLSTQHVSRLSFGIPSATPTQDRNGGSRPSSRASVSSNVSHSHTSSQLPTSLSRPSSRQSISGARTPLGHYSTSTMNESRRPRSSVGGSYASLHGHGHSASVSNIQEKDSEMSTPVPRRTTLKTNDLAGVSVIPTPTGLKKRPSVGTGLPMPAGARRISSNLHHREDGDMPPPERRKKLSEVGETF